MSDRRPCSGCTENLRVFGWLCPTHAGTHNGAHSAGAVEALRRALATGVRIDRSMRDVRAALDALAAWRRRSS